jgi:hypothetical protein
MPLIPAKAITITSMSIGVDTTGANLARLFIYSDQGSRPAAKLFESTDISLGTGGYRWTNAINLTLSAGLTYWVGYQSNGTQAKMSSIAPASRMPITSTRSNYNFRFDYGTCPNSLTGSAEWPSPDINAILPWIDLGIA